MIVEIICAARIFVLDIGEKITQERDNRSLSQLNKVFLESN